MLEYALAMYSSKSFGTEGNVLLAADIYALVDEKSTKKIR